MNTILEKTKIIFNKVCNLAQRVVYSDVYTLCVCLFAYIVWCLDLSILGVCTFCVLAMLTLLFCNDLSALFLPIVVSLTSVRNASSQQILALWPLYVVVLLCGIFFIWRNFPKKFKLGTMFFPQVAVSFALLIGGVGVISTQNYLRALPLVLALSLGILCVYFLFVNFCKEGRDVPLYFAKVCVCLGLVVGAELFTVILQSGLSPSEWTGIGRDVGWGNRNMVATVFPFAFVMSFYLCTRAKKFSFVYMLVAFLEFACLIFTMSRGGVLFGSMAFVTALVMAIIKGKRKELLICLGSVVVVILLICLVLQDKAFGLLTSLWSRFSEIHFSVENGKLLIEGTSGRFGEDALYGIALRAFKAHPFFGIGVGHVEAIKNVSISKMDWFHSTVLEIMADMGIVGMLCYGYYYAMRFCKVFAKGNIKNKFPLFVFITWIAFEGQSLVDVGLLEPVFIILVTLQLAIMENFNGESYEETAQILQLFPPAISHISTAESVQE